MSFVEVALGESDAHWQEGTIEDAPTSDPSSCSRNTPFVQAVLNTGRASKGSYNY